MRSVLTLFLLAATVASAQFSFPSYKPSQCMVIAQELAIEGTTDGKVIAIACAGIKVPLLGTELYLGIDMAQGTAPVWFYVVRSEQRDSVAGTALIRMTDVCSTPPIEDIPDAADVGEYGEEAIPTTFIEGKELVDKVNANGDYVKFHAAHPDTLPTAAVISVSQEEFFGFPAGTPFWVFVWAPAQQGGLPFACYVHAVTGQTVCLGETTMGVSGGDAAQAGYSVYPNPSSGTAMLNIPITMLGKQLHVEAVSVTGQRVLLADDVAVTVPALINTNTLSAGMWSLVVTSGSSHHTVPLMVVR